MLKHSAGGRRKFQFFRNIFQIALF